MKRLGLDIGSKRIGLAISDELGITARGLLVLERKKDEVLIDKIRDIIRQENVGELVVGLPLNMDGSTGPQAQKAISFASGLKDKLNIAVKLWDERMSTLEVERIMIDGGASRRKRKQKVDKLAASVVLQSYLNAQKNQ